MGRDWSVATAAATWPGRYGHASVVYDGKMWVVGAGPTSAYPFVANDVWYSSDGVRWTSATMAAQWPPRTAHAAVVFANKIWVMGGDSGVLDPRHRNDVWYSSDGRTWTSATLSAPWPARAGHTSVVFGGKMWVLGGGSPESGLKNDVWYSADGVHWTSATLSAKWSPRAVHTSVVHDGKMWVIGGYVSKSDVWYSSDGVNWTSATLSAPWGPRARHTSVVCDGKIWVIAGDAGQAGLVNDAWYSSDGVTWAEATGSAPWTGRDGATSVVFNQRIYLLGGYADYIPLFRNDVWYSEGTISRARAWWRY